MYTRDPNQAAAAMLGRLLLEPHPAGCGCETCLYWERETQKALRLVDAQLAWADGLDKLDAIRKKGEP